MITKRAATFMLLVLLALGPGDASGHCHPLLPAGATPVWCAKALAFVHEDQLRVRRDLGLKSDPSWTSSGDDQGGATIGVVIPAAGDVNGDGFDDVIVGAPNFSGPGLQCGILKASYEVAEAQTRDGRHGVQDRAQPVRWKLRGLCVRWSSPHHPGPSDGSPSRALGLTCPCTPGGLLAIGLI